MNDFPNSTEGLLKFWLTHMDFMAPQKNAVSRTHIRTSLAHGFFPLLFVLIPLVGGFNPCGKY